MAAEEVKVVAAAVEVVVLVDEGVGLGGGGGDGEGEGDESCGGTAGLGHVLSFEFSGQNSRILSNKYHCRLLEKDRRKFISLR